MTLTETHATCIVGVLDHRKYSEQLLPMIERARRSTTSATAVEELRAFIMGVGNGTRREDALTQLERIEVAVQSSRWHRSAAGHVLEAACVGDLEEIPDLMSMLESCSNFLYGWDQERAEVIYRFFGFLSDNTLLWASPGDTWRAAVAPESLRDVADAMGALSPRDLRKLLENAEEGDVFSADEAREFSDWWGAIRKAIRMAVRTEQGLYISVREDA